MDIPVLCAARGWRRIAFLGASKHAGKTTALCAVLRQAVRAGHTVGLVSFGVDGERVCALSGVEKPAIEVPAGALAASAERALLASEVQMEWLEALPIPSPLGPVMITRAKTTGALRLAGVRQREHLRTVLPRLEAAGASLCLVDGAFDRVGAIDPALVDAVVCSVGAAAGRSIEEVVQSARRLLARFTLPAVDTGLRQRFAAARSAGAAAITVTTLEARTEQMPAPPEHDVAARLLWVQRTLAEMFEACTLGTGHSGTPATECEWALYWPGALTEAVAERLLTLNGRGTVILEHPAQALVDWMTLVRLGEAGHRVCVWTPLPVAAVTVNPVSPFGWTLPVDDLQAAVQAVVPGVPVFNPLGVEWDDDAEELADGKEAR